MSERLLDSVVLSEMSVTLRKLAMGCIFLNNTSKAARWA